MDDAYNPVRAKHCLFLLRMHCPFTRQDVAAARRENARAWHPDRFAAAGGDELRRAQDRMMRINAACDYLERHYEQIVHAWSQGTFQWEGPRPGPGLRGQRTHLDWGTTEQGTGVKGTTERFKEWLRRTPESTGEPRVTSPKAEADPEPVRSAQGREDTVRHQTERAFAEQRKAVERAEAELKQRQTVADRRDADLRERDTELRDRDSDLCKRIAELRQAEERLQERDVALRQQITRAEQSGARLQERELQLTEREAAVKRQEGQVQQAGEDLRQRVAYASIEQKRHEAEIEARRIALSAGEQEVRQRHIALSTRENKLDQRETAVTQREEALEQIDQRIKHAKDVLEPREAALQQSAAELAQQQTLLRQQAALLGPRKAELDRREADLLQREAALVVRDLPADHAPKSPRLPVPAPTPTATPIMGPTAVPPSAAIPFDYARHARQQRVRAGLCPDCGAKVAQWWDNQHDRCANCGSPAYKRERPPAPSREVTGSRL